MRLFNFAKNIFGCRTFLCFIHNMPCFSVSVVRRCVSNRRVFSIHCAHHRVFWFRCACRLFCMAAHLSTPHAERMDGANLCRRQWPRGLRADAAGCRRRHECRGPGAVFAFEAVVTSVWVCLFLLVNFQALHHVGFFVFVSAESFSPRRRMLNDFFSIVFDGALNFLQVCSSFSFYFVRALPCFRRSVMYS
jgi:hypothetical protein